MARQRSVKYYIKRYIPEENQKGLVPVGSRPGKLYGLCKVHKDNYPMRPIVSMVNTPEYHLSKYFDNFIKPNIPQTYMLKSTNDFLMKLKYYKLSGEEKMVSYDVVSLFTNVPLLETVEIILDLVYGTSSITTPPFEREIFRKMLIFCSQSYFLYNDDLYLQTDGVSMGGPLAPSFANVFLAHLENTKLRTLDISNFKPKLLLRYVDDCFALFNNLTDAVTFLSFLNSMHPSIKFTLERGDICMPFLDVNIKIDCDSFVTSVYRKPTHTGVFLNFLSVAPISWKRGVIYCLLYRAKLICSNLSLFNDEVCNLRKMFIANAYPVSFFDNVLHKFLWRNNVDPSKPAPEEVEDEDAPFVIFRVPYFGKCSVDFARNISNVISHNFSVRVRVVYSTFKVKSYFSLKSFSPVYLSSNIVYCFDCVSDSCTNKYVGYTIRHFYERCEEHVNIKKSGKSEIKDHVKTCVSCKNRSIDYHDFKILRRCRTEVQCKLFEAFAIKRIRPSLNKQLFAQGASKILHVWK